MSTRETGARAEDFAAGVLQKRGSELLARNYYTPYGEVDLIVRDGNCIAFVEVKARRVGSLVRPAQAVDRRKQKKLVMAATAWLSATGSDLQPRFDVAAVTLEECRGRELVSGFDYYESAFST